MASPILLPAAFDGMVQDFPRNNLPKGKAWNIVDYIPEQLGAPATERGGWSYASASLTAVDASAQYVAAALEAPFTAGTQVVLIDNSAKLIKVVGGVNTAISGTANVPAQNLFMHQQLVVIPSPNGTIAPQQYDGTTLAALGATAPAGKYGAVWVNYTWLGGQASNPQRAFASAVGDPTSFAQTGTSASFVDVSFPIKGMAALPNVLLVFGDKKTARFRGTTPPPSSDMSVDDPVFNYGCIDARSIAVNGSLAVFANASGVYLTNGTAFPEDLTKSCGISAYWRNLIQAGFDPTSWQITSGWYGNFVVVSVNRGGGLLLPDTIVFDTVKRSAFRVSNLVVGAFASGSSFGAELYAGSRTSPRLLELSTMWTPSAGVKNDADGTVVAGLWESPFYDTQRVGSQRWRDAYLLYDLRDAASDSPTMTLAYCASPEAGAAYTTLSPIAAAGTKKSTKRIPVRTKNRGLGFKVTRANSASFARLYGIAATVYSREGSRLDA